jgi:long-subunit acyl-CoA synthetase (AMP-forming)
VGIKWKKRRKNERRKEWEKLANEQVGLACEYIKIKNIGANSHRVEETSRFCVFEEPKRIQKGEME